MEKQYNVFIQWHENALKYDKFDRGLEKMNKKPFRRVEAANEAAADWLYDGFNDYVYSDSTREVLMKSDGEGQEVAVVVYVPEPACYDFGDGVIHVREVLTTYSIIDSTNRVVANVRTLAGAQIIVNGCPDLRFEEVAS